MSPGTPARRMWRARARGVALDLSPLQTRDFRLLWTGEIFSEIGSNITLVAVLLQVDALTHDPAAVGCCSARRSVKRVPPGFCSPARSSPAHRSGRCTSGRDSSPD